MTCAQAENCKFIAWLKEQKAKPDCGKNPDNCGRLDDLYPEIRLDDPLPRTREELQLAAKILGYSQ